MSDVFQVQSTLIADDIRFEVGGKQTIVGAYVDAIVIETIPYYVKLAIRITVKINEKKNIICTCMIISPDNTIVSSETTSTNVTFPQYGVSLGFVNMGGTVNTAGEYQILLNVDGTVQPVSSFHVVLRSQLNIG